MQNQELSTQIHSLSARSDQNLRMKQARPIKNVPSGATDGNWLGLIIEYFKSTEAQLLSREIESYYLKTRIISL